MRKEYDFSKAKKNPYAKRLKKQITIRVDEPTIGRHRKNPPRLVGGPRASVQGSTDGRLVGGIGLDERY